MKRATILKVFLLMAAFTLGCLTMNGQSLFAKMQKALPLDKGTKVTYVSTFKDKSGRTLSSNKGTLIVKGRLFRLEDQVTAVYNGKDLIYYNPEDNTLNFSSPGEEELIQINPFIAVNSAGTYYNIAEKGSQIVMTPKRRGNITKIIITLNGANIPTNISLLMKDKSKMLINLTNTVQVNASNSTFVLGKKQYPGAEIVDMR